MSDYSKYSIKELEELREDLYKQEFTLNKTLHSVKQAIVDKKSALDNNTLIANPYYKDKASVIKVTVNDSDYTITKIHIQGRIVGIDVFRVKDIEPLKYFKMCTKVDWDKAVETLNCYLKGIKIDEIS